jgi:large subunit ribosomal protein L28
MSRVCALTGKKVQFGNNVSHSKRRTNRRFQPNLQKVTLESEALGHGIPLRVSTRALRTVQKKGGLDLFLLKTADKDLTEIAQRLKRQIKKRITTPAAAKTS